MNLNYFYLQNIQLINTIKCFKKQKGQIKLTIISINHISHEVLAGIQ